MPESSAMPLVTILQNGTTHSAEERENVLIEHEIFTAPSRHRRTVEILIYGDKIGGVIGKCGSGVGSLREETGCIIKVHGEDTASIQRRVVLTGPADCVEMALDVLGSRFGYTLPTTNEVHPRPTMQEVMGANEQAPPQNASSLALHSVTVALSNRLEEVLSINYARSDETPPRRTRCPGR